MAVLGLRFCVRAFSSCGKRGPLFIAVRGPLTITASLVAEHRLQTRRLSNCGSGAQPLRGMWDPPRPGREPVSPALAGRFPTLAPPGKPLSCSFNHDNVPICIWLHSQPANLCHTDTCAQPTVMLLAPVTSWQGKGELSPMTSATSQPTQSDGHIREAHTVLLRPSLIKHSCHFSITSVPAEPPLSLHSQHSFFLIFSGIGSCK